jgi:hypothetical protein
MGEGVGDLGFGERTGGNELGEFECRNVSCSFLEPGLVAATVSASRASAVSAYVEWTGDSAPPAGGVFFWASQRAKKPYSSDPLAGCPLRFSWSGDPFVRHQGLEPRTR